MAIYSTRIAYQKTGLTLLILLIAIGIAFGQSFSVGTTSITFIDSDRNNRNIPCDVYYPAASNGANTDWADGSFGHVVFGHGFVMAVSSYQTIASALAASGFVVLLPTTEGGLLPSHENFGRDLAFVAEDVVAKSQDEEDFFFEKITGNFAVGGHSMGGGATYLSHQFLTASANCYFTFAAAETNPSATAAVSDIESPNLFFAGELDCVTPPDVQQGMYNSQSDAACKYYIEILGGFHCQFNDPSFTCNLGESSCSPGGGISLNDQVDIVLSFLVPWLSSWLNNECDDWDDFTTLALTSQDIDLMYSCDIDPLPEPSINTIGQIPACPGDTVTLFAEGVEGFTPLWNNGETGHEITVTEAGEYYYTLELENCVFQSDTIEVSITEDPNASIVLTTELPGCAGDTIVLTSNTDVDNIIWNTSDSSNNLMVTETGTYFFTYTMAECNFLSDSMTITFIDDPQAVISWDESIINCPGDSIWLGVEVEVDEVIWNEDLSSDSLLVTNTQVVDFAVRVDNCFFSGESIEVVFEEDWTIGNIIGSDSVITDLIYAFVVEGEANWFYNWTGGGFEILSGQGTPELEVIITAEGGTAFDISVLVDDLSCKDTLIVKSVVVETSLSAQNISKSNLLVRYGESTWHIDFDNFGQSRSMILSNSSGKVINVWNDNNSTVEIDNFSLPSGLYILSINEGGDRANTLKLMKW